ncbi:MAG: 5'-nucleotidase C-terminal domain-containing protein [Syntrophorhabdaceae bacterium]|nr:5'-nucleotidase C-terminal domain-containing protein [Syntrophorhabdaceae bacterium]MDD5243032.1 5'-nucleotidase C-terminal domain-containing protein [Syntrophorhabdaceae bacterium]
MFRMKKVLIALIVCVALSVLSVPPAHCQFKELRILHMNDFHGFATGEKLIGSNEMQGGISYLAWLADNLRKEKPTLLLAAGDMIQGSPFANLFQGKPVIEIMNKMGFDAMCVGNHEFDYGKDILRERIAEATFPVLGANVKGMPELKPYTIKELEGLKIAIIGVVTEDTPVATHPGNVEGLTFLSPVATVEKYVRELRGSVDIIIVLSHLGYNADMVLASRVKGIDIIVGGHSHTRTIKHMLIGNTVLVQAWEYGMVLGVLDVVVKSGKIIEMKSRLEEIKPSHMKKQEDVAQIVERYTRQMDALMGQTIGEALVDLDGKNVRTKETNLGNLITDIMRQRSSSRIALINGGGIRTSIRKGNITLNDIYSALPFDNYIVAMKLTGREIKEALEHGVSGVELKEGRFLQVSGLSFTYDPKMPQGLRVMDVSVGGAKMDINTTYTVCTNDFLAAGGDGYKLFREALKESQDFSITANTITSDKVTYNDSGRPLKDVVADYIKEKKRITATVEGRIQEVSCNEGVCKQPGNLSAPRHDR